TVEGPRNYQGCSILSRKQQVSRSQRCDDGVEHRTWATEPLYKHRETTARSTRSDGFFLRTSPVGRDRSARSGNSTTGAEQEQHREPRTTRPYRACVAQRVIIIEAVGAAP